MKKSDRMQVFSVKKSQGRDAADACAVETLVLRFTAILERADTTDRSMESLYRMATDAADAADISDNGGGFEVLGADTADTAAVETGFVGLAAEFDVSHAATVGLNCSDVEPREIHGAHPRVLYFQFVALQTGNLDTGHAVVLDFCQRRGVDGDIDFCRGDVDIVAYELDFKLVAVDLEAEQIYVVVGCREYHSAVVVRGLDVLHVGNDVDLYLVEGLLWVLALDDVVTGFNHLATIDGEVVESASRQQQTAQTHE